MVLHVLHAAVSAQCNDIAVVAGNGFDLVKEAVEKGLPEAQVFEQTERLGTAHAVLAARNAINAGYDDILVLFGDTPLVSSETLLQIRQTLATDVSVAVLGFEAEDPSGYGRLIEKDGDLVAIREHKDATAQERKIKLCNGGIIGLSGQHALSMLEAINNDNANQEYYLPDVVEIANKRGLGVKALRADHVQVLGANTRVELAEIENFWQERKRRELMLDGVSMQAPHTVFFNSDTIIESGVVIEPNVVFSEGVTVRQNAKIRAFSHLEGADVGAGAIVGPYARLRPGSKLGDEVRIGNFVEIKNANLEKESKVNHLTYIGDSDIGSGANIGAGTITCNYDGMNKHRTVIGVNAFVGSNSSLVAPVTIGDGAYVASGSVVTENVPEDALGIARGRQTNKDGMATEIRARNAKLKAERAAGESS